MTWKQIVISYHKGAIEARETLTSPESWTDLMYYIHCSRLILGVILGFLMGTFLFA
jgi:hypothetical protein